MRTPFLCVSVLALLAACGGGGGSSSSTSSAVTIAGAVIDGYIEGAIVCLDVNANSACDSTEPRATTDSDGKYSFSYSGSTTGLHVLTEVPTTAKDKDDNGLTLAQAGKTAFTLQAPAPAVSSTDIHVTPLSTMVSQEMVQSGSTNAATVEAQLKTQLGINTNLLKYDFKATTSTANTNAAALAVAITNAIAAAQTSLASSDAFKTALGTTDATTIKAAAAQGAINLVMKNVLPQMIDKDTGGLSSTVSTASAMEAASSVASSNAKSMAVKSSAPKAENASLQAFLDGIVIGGNDSSGDYINDSGVRINGNWSGYTNALKVEFLKVKADTQSSTEIRKVLVNNKWYTRYDSGGNYFLTAKGWLPEEKDLPGGPLGSCVGGPLTSEGPTQKICMTKYDYSGKKVSSLLKEVCKDNSGSTISGCNEDTVFPANTYSYTATLSYSEESYKMWVDTNWGGYGSGFNPVQTTLSGFLSHMKNTNTQVYIGNNCNISVKVKSFNAATMTGEFAFADSSSYTCSNAHQNDMNLDYTKHTATFSMKEKAGSKMIVFQVPMIYIKNNPNDSSVWRLFGEYNNGIRDGSYFPTGYSQTFGLDGSMKIGNKNLLNTYLTMVGAPAFPYPQ